MTKLTEKQESLLNELLEDFQGNTEAVMGSKGLMSQLRKRVVEVMLDEEMTSHLGYAPHDPAGNGSGNSRNGHTEKKVQSKDGDLALEIPRDRNGSFRTPDSQEGPAPHGRRATVNKPRRRAKSTIRVGTLLRSCKPSTRDRGNGERLTRSPCHQTDLFA